MKHIYVNDRALIEVLVNLSIDIHDTNDNDKIIKSIKDHNVITTNGKNLIRDLLGNLASTDGVTHFATGTDDTDVSIADTTLGAEIYRHSITSAVYTDKKVSFKYYLSSTQANGNTLVEAGLFGRDATSTANSGDLVAHVTHDPIVKTSSVAITFSWDITIA